MNVRTPSFVKASHNAKMLALRLSHSLCRSLALSIPRQNDTSELPRQRKLTIALNRDLVVRTANDAEHTNGADSGPRGGIPYDPIGWIY